jgi:ceramide glucosyltransferase
MNLGNLLLWVLASLAVSTCLYSMVALLWVVRRPRRKAEFTPPVSVLKPLKGVDEGLEENLRSFFLLDYPAYELLFGVIDPEDPAVAVVRRLLQEFPEHDARLIVGRPGFGLNPKVENLARLYPERKYDTILISDSNVRVRPAYLRETAGYLGEPGVGLVSNLIAGTGEGRFGAALENLQLNGFVAGSVAATAISGVTCVVGKSMLLPVRVLEAIGGLAAVRNVLAEDQVIGLKVREAGYAIRLSHHVIESPNQSRDLRWFLNRHSRWYKLRRRLAAPAFLLEPTTNLAAVGLVWLLAADLGLAWVGLPLLALGIARDAVQTRWLRGSVPRLRYLLLSPVKDLFLLPLWLDALVSRQIVWRGNRRSVGRLTRLRLAHSRTPRRIRRRARRIRKLRARRKL